MQKVVYVLLQQHAERYWQMDHDDDYLGDGSDESYHDIGMKIYTNSCVSVLPPHLTKSKQRKCRDNPSTLPHDWSPVRKGSSVHVDDRTSPTA